MQLGTAKRGKWQVVYPVGRVDGHTAPELESVLQETIDAGELWLAIHLGEVTYLSSAGLRALLDTLKRLRSREGDICLIGPRDNVREVLDITGFSELFSVVEQESAMP